MENYIKMYLVETDHVIGRWMEMAQSGVKYHSLAM
jgi:hypothetical protein